MTPEAWADLRETVGRIDERTKLLDQLPTKEEVKGVKDRVTSLEDERTWVKRLSVTAVLSAALAIVKQHWGVG